MFFLLPKTHLSKLLLSIFSHRSRLLRTAVDTACYEFALVARQELPRLKQRLLADLREPATLLPPRRLRFYPVKAKDARETMIE